MSYLNRKLVRIKFVMYLTSKTIFPFMTFLSGAGIISFIDAYEYRKQHQKDITMNEIRNCKHKLVALNNKIQLEYNYLSKVYKFDNHLKNKRYKKKDRKKLIIIKYHKSPNKIKSSIKVNKIWIIGFLSSWSVNIKYNRIYVNMVKYSLTPILHNDYTLIYSTLKVLKDSKIHNYDSEVKNVKYLFNKCAIIKKKRKWHNCLLKKN